MIPAKKTRHIGELETDEADISARGSESDLYNPFGVELIFVPL